MVLLFTSDAIFQPYKNQRKKSMLKMLLVKLNAKCAVTPSSNTEATRICSELKNAFKNFSWRSPRKI